MLPRTAPSLPARGSCWVGGLGACLVGIQGGYTGCVGGGLYRYPAAKPSRRTATAGSGPCLGRGVPEAGWAPTWCSAAGTVQPTLRARSAHPGGPPWLDLADAASGPIWRDSTSFLRNLVKTTKCHRKCAKRPVIVPNLKTGLKYHLLIF